MDLSVEGARNCHFDNCLVLMVVVVKTRHWAERRREVCSYLSFAHVRGGLRAEGIFLDNLRSLLYHIGCVEDSLATLVLSRSDSFYLDEREEKICVRCHLKPHQKFAVKVTVSSSCRGPVLEAF